MPCNYDLYFPPEDVQYEALHIPNNVYYPSDSIWGHFAGGGANPVDINFINDAVAKLLDMPAFSKPKM